MAATSPDSVEEAARALFHRLDPTATGYIQEIEVQRVWPALTRYASGAMIAKYENGGLQVSLAEWLSLISLLTSLVGPQCLRASLRGADRIVSKSFFAVSADRSLRDTTPLLHLNFARDFAQTVTTAMEMQTLLQRLAKSPGLRTLNLSRCPRIAASAWDSLRGVQWPLLRSASFNQCFKEDGRGAEVLLQTLSTSKHLEELDLTGCEKLPGSAWHILSRATWTLQRGDFNGCFLEDGSGADALFQVLAKSALKELDLLNCPKIPPNAWQRLSNGIQWPLERAWFGQCFQENGHGAEALFGLLSRCNSLRLLNLEYSSRIPGSAWKMLKGAMWPHLRKASFKWCFKDYGSGANVLMQVLARCESLEQLDLTGCHKILGSAWNELSGANWPSLEEVNLQWCFISSHSTERIMSLKQALQSCKKAVRVDLEGCPKSFGILKP